MELIEEISFILGVTISILFYMEYRRVEKLEEKEELVDKLLN
jgi:hypothetical protein